MATLSCCMIVRDAESTLERALQSVQGHVDELVVVDTGSVDNTRAIARRYADRLLDFEWCDNFAAARQFAHEACSSEWVFYIDADDQVIDAGALRARIADAPSEIDAYMIRYVLGQNSAGDVLTEFYRERLIRKERMRWAGRVHEVMLPTAGSCKYERFDGTWVLHHGHGDERSSMERNLRLLRLQLADMPDDTRTMFYLGRDLVVTGKLKEGRKLLQRYMKSATWLDEMYMAQSLIAYCYRAEGLYKEAYDADIQLLYINPLWPQAYFMLAQDCYYQKQFDRSVFFCEVAQRLPAPVTNLFVSRELLTYEWMIYQVVALYQVGRLADAAELTERALALHPADVQHLANQGYFAGLAAAS